MAKRNAQALAARARKAGPHTKVRKPDVFDQLDDDVKTALCELAVRWQKELETFEVHEHVRVTHGRWKGEEGRIVMSRQDKGWYGVVFDGDARMITEYFAGNHIERSEP